MFHSPPPPLSSLCLHHSPRPSTTSIQRALANFQSRRSCRARFESLRARYLDLEKAESSDTPPSICLFSPELAHVISTRPYSFHRSRRSLFNSTRLRHVNCYAFNGISRSVRSRAEWKDKAPRKNQRVTFHAGHLPGPFSSPRSRAAVFGKGTTQIYRGVIPRHSPSLLVRSQVQKTAVPGTKVASRGI